MRRERREKDFRKKPIYPGGISALKQFIKDNLAYPQAALDAKVEGSVLVQYTVDHLGKVTSTKVISGIGYGCDEEAKRVIKLLKFEVPKNRGYKSKSLLTIGVHFKLKEVKNIATTTFEYNVVSSQKKEEKEDGNPNTYHYTIEW